MKRGVFGKIYNAGKHMAKASFELVGLELRTKPGARAPLPPPPLYDDPLEAMYEERGGVAAAFRCPIDKIVDINGFGFAPHHWHPFVATVVERERHGNARAEALLERFYAAHQPQNATDAIVGFDNPPDLFQRYVPHIYYLMPWCAGSPECTVSKVEDWVHKDNVEHGQKDMTLESHGFPQHGPVQRKKCFWSLGDFFSWPTP